MENIIMTLDEVAEYLRISMRTVYRWIETKGLPIHKIGGLDRVVGNQEKDTKTNQGGVRGNFQEFN